MATTIPGTLAERRAQRGIPAFPTDTGTAFFVGLATSGTTTAAVPVTTMDEYTAEFGAGTGTAAVLYDSVQAALEEGAQTVYVGRVATAALDADWLAALALFPRTLGPGQVAAPGRSTITAHQQLLDHAANFNRTALLDTAFEADKAGLLTAADSVDGYANAKTGGLFAQWLQVPEVTAGVDRFVPPSAVVAGVAARVPGADNVAPIAERGRLRYATAAATTFSDADRTDLYEAGVNVFLDDPPRPRLYGFRSITTDPDWFDLAHNRLFMAVEARAAAIAEQFVGERITPAVVTTFSGHLEGMLAEVYASDALFGERLNDAVAVITDETVNNATTAAARELAAQLYIRAAEHADLVRTIAVKVPVTTTVA